jgi:hypothetical protein
MEAVSELLRLGNIGDKKIMKPPLPNQPHICGFACQKKTKGVYCIANAHLKMPVIAR